jgi:predicted dehydrogenase
VVGLGNIAQAAVLPAFEHATENSELVALVSGNRTKLQEVGDRYDVEHRGSYEEMERVLAASRADAVYIALPNTMHREYAERAARVGVHVLCEKPMAMTVRDCEAMMDAAAHHRVKLMIAYRLHFEEANLRALEIARSGRIGEVRLFSSVFSHEARPGDIRTRDDVGGGALFDMGIYCINAARHLFGAEPIEVFGVRLEGPAGWFDPHVDATTTAVLRFPDDRIAQLTASQRLAGVSSYRIVGSEGDLRVEPAYGYAGELVHHLTVGEDTKTKKFAKRDQFAPQLVYFSRCVLDDLQPEPSGAEGLADVRVMEAIVRSAREGKPVELPPFGRSCRPDLSQEMRKPPVSEPETVQAPSPTAK